MRKLANKNLAFNLEYGILDEETGKLLKLASDGKVEWTKRVTEAKTMPSPEHAYQLAEAVLGKKIIEVVRIKTKLITNVGYDYEI